MSTEAQNTANLENAQLSTGPRTEKGKAISSRNSLSHGLTAKTALLPDEDADAYQALTQGMFKDFDPLNATQSALTQELVDVQWRINRVPRIEAGILSGESPDLKYLGTIGLYASRLKRQYSATLKELTRLVEASRKSLAEKLDDAAMIHLADYIEKRPSSLAQFGFDFSIPEIEAYVDQKQTLRKARLTVGTRGVGWAA